MGTSDEDSYNDNTSVISIASDSTFIEEGLYHFFNKLNS